LKWFNIKRCFRINNIKCNFNKYFQYLNESFNFSSIFKKYYDYYIEVNKKENNSLLFLYQTTCYNIIGAFKEKHHEKKFCI